MSKIVKGIGKAVKGIVKGVGKAFKKVWKSKIGRALLVAAAVYVTGGMAGLWSTPLTGGAAGGAGLASSQAAAAPLVGEGLAVASAPVAAAPVAAAAAPAAKTGLLGAVGSGRRGRWDGAEGRRAMGAGQSRSGPPGGADGGRRVAVRGASKERVRASRPHLRP